MVETVGLEDNNLAETKGRRRRREEEGTSGGKEGNE